MILVDSGFLFAFIDKDDPNHEVADKIMIRALSGDYGKLIVTNYIVDEVLTLSRVRTKGCASGKALQTFLKSKKEKTNIFFNIIISQKLIDICEEYYQIYCKKGLSFTDCSLLACMKEYQIEYLASFDKTFKGIVNLLLN